MLKLTWRNVPRAHPDQRPVDLLPVILLSVLPQRPRNYRRDSPKPEKVIERRINLARRVQPAGSNQAPNHATTIHGAAIGTAEAIRLVRATDIVDVSQHPQRNADLRQGADDGRQPLRKEQRAWWDFHIVAQFHVHGKVNTLADDVRGQDLEAHVGHGFALEHVPPNKLAQHVELVCIYVGDSLDDAAGYHVDCWDDECEEDTVNR